MTAPFETASKQQSDVIVIGAGPVGLHFIKTLQEKKPHCSITVFSNEACQPYQRMQLTSFLAGQSDLEQISRPLTVQQSNEKSDDQIEKRPDQTLHFIQSAIVSIDRHNRCVIDDQGRRYYFKKLILAIGSRPHIPNIRGVKHRHVYTFRTLEDAQALQERGKQSRRIVIVGGGLLALETAQALQQQIDGIKTSAKGKPGMKAAEIILVQHASRLMNEQLDEHAANLLLEKTKDMGLEVYLNCGVGDITARENGISEQAINEQAINERTFSETSVLQDKEEIETHTAVHCVRLRNGVEIPCDTVVLCTGVVPNIALAKACNLRIRRGIAVNDCMQTSDLDIYAIGECAEYNKQVYGFVEPGYQQAEIAASHIAKEKKSHLNKQINNSLLPLTQLKLTDYPVFSIGLVDQELSAAKLTSLCWEDTQSGTYRRLFLRRGKVVGALAVKPWPELSKLQEAIEHHARIGLLAKRRFAKTGQVYGPLFNLESFFKTTSPPDNTATTTADLTASHQDKTQTDT